MRGRRNRRVGVRRDAEVGKEEGRDGGRKKERKRSM